MLQKSHRNLPQESVLEADPELAQRIVFMTGGVFDDGKREFLARVTNKVVTKPINGKKITQLAREYRRQRDG